MFKHIISDILMHFIIPVVFLTPRSVTLSTKPRVLFFKTRHVRHIYFENWASRTNGHLGNRGIFF